MNGNYSGRIEIGPRIPIYDFPSRFINIYGIRLGMISYKHNGGLRDSYYDLTDLYLESIYPLVQQRSFIGVTSIGDINKQSIVHFKVGVLGNGEQRRVMFYFKSLPESPNIVQFFVGENLEYEYEIEDVDEELEHNHLLVLTGDGRTTMDIYMRPASYVTSHFPALLFIGAEIVEDES